MDRPRAYKNDHYPWNFRRLADDPSKREYAIFVVHGIGQQDFTETAATLRSGLEEAIIKIAEWQEDQKISTLSQEDLHRFPPPFILDGHWANYSDLEKTFEEDWKHFNAREKSFFGKLWHIRTLKITRTYFWFLRQQLRLLMPTVLGAGGVSTLSYALYWVMAPVAVLFLTMAAVRHPKVLTGFLSDVRLYAAPRGIIENAIVQRIDYRVGRRFLSLIGLDWDFKPLPEDEDLEASTENVDFKRIIWVAHSLGTVISYNVLSDLCHRAIKLKKSGTAVQKKGAKKFLSRLYRFVTMGSPLDKFAFLFKGSLRPWPDDLAKHIRLPAKEDGKGNPGGFWVNFYSAFDPVSGALDNKKVYGKFLPRNFHARNWRCAIPAYSHSAYWKDQFTLSYILSRTVGRDVLEYDEFEALDPWARRILVIIAYLVWFGLFIAIPIVAFIWWPEIWTFIKTQITNVLG